MKDSAEMAVERDSPIVTQLNLLHQTRQNHRRHILELYQRFDALTSLLTGEKEDSPREEVL